MAHKRFGKSIRRITGQATAQVSRNFAPANLQRTGAALAGFAVGGPAGAASALFLSEGARSAGKEAQSAERRNLVLDAALQKEADDKAAADAAIVEPDTPASSTDKIKKRFRGQTALIATSQRGVLGAASIGRRRLSAF